jgi:hypothetical protein
LYGQINYQDPESNISVVSSQYMPQLIKSFQKRSQFSVSAPSRWVNKLSLKKVTNNSDIKLVFTPFEINEIMQTLNRITATVEDFMKSQAEENKKLMEAQAEGNKKSNEENKKLMKAQAEENKKLMEAQVEENKKLM